MWWQSRGRQHGNLCMLELVTLCDVVQWCCWGQQLFRVREYVKPMSQACEMNIFEWWVDGSWHGWMMGKGVRGSFYERTCEGVELNDLTRASKGICLNHHMRALRWTNRQWLLRKFVQMNKWRRYNSLVSWWVSWLVRKLKRRNVWWLAKHGVTMIHRGWATYMGVLWH